MKLKFYQIDAFTEKNSEGSPACIVPLSNWLSDDLLQKIAKETAVPETAFFVYNNNKIHLRWFTPDIEMDLCGHATLAAAHCLKSILSYKNDKIVFETLSGDLTVCVQNGIYHLNFPSRKPIISVLPLEIKNALNIQPKDVYKARDYMLVYDSEEQIKNIKIDINFFNKINLNTGGVIVTAKGDEVDFVSRYFTPQASVLEDPVTGSSHCSLIPYWSERLGKNKLIAMQLSKRKGTLFCENNNDRVIISGMAKTYSIGHLWTE